jgi:hypothetical protein
MAGHAFALLGDPKSTLPLPWILADVVWTAGNNSAQMVGCATASATPDDMGTPYYGAPFETSGWTEMADGDSWFAYFPGSAGAGHYIWTTTAGNIVNNWPANAPNGQMHVWRDQNSITMISLGSTNQPDPGRHSGRTVGQFVEDNAGATPFVGAFCQFCKRIDRATR